MPSVSLRREDQREDDIEEKRERERRRNLRSGKSDQAVGEQHRRPKIEYAEVCQERHFMVVGGRCEQGEIVRYGGEERFDALIRRRGVKPRSERVDDTAERGGNRRRCGEREESAERCRLLFKARDRGERHRGQAPDQERLDRIVERGLSDVGARGIRGLRRRLVRRTCQHRSEMRNGWSDGSEIDEARDQVDEIRRQPRAGREDVGERAGGCDQDIP
jgi:hypothetical protein